MEKNFNVTVFIVERQTPYSEMKILGKTPREYMAENLPASENFYIVETNDEKAAENLQTNAFSVPPASVLKTTDEKTDNFSRPPAPAVKTTDGKTDYFSHPHAPAVETTDEKVNDFFVRLYSDMPLAAKDEIIALCESMLYRNLDCIRIGDARIYKKNPSNIPAVKNITSDGFLSVDGGRAYATTYELLRKKILFSHIENGVLISDLNSVVIDSTVLIGKGTYIAPNNVIKEKTVVGQNNKIESGNIIENSIIGDENVIIQSNLSDCNIADKCKIGPFSILRENAHIGDENTVIQSNLSDCNIADKCKIGPFSILRENANIGDENTVIQSNLSDCNIARHCSVGPFATLRGGANIGSGCRIGDYVEIKKSVLKDGVKAAHLAYIGDAEIGKKTNIGCGTVFANYNGKIKQKTVVGENVFIGANTNLVAPLSVGGNSFIAAGSTITENIPENSFAIARERQITKKKEK
jgi:bifunctional N-acetylglucosamine-1-phosphate-uridyltransferase/glucosamine-1-phosphate-acetyltransferase GlmU-like protein